MVTICLFYESNPSPERRESWRYGGRTALPLFLKVSNILGVLILLFTRVLTPKPLALRSMFDETEYN